jgi:hypothetical protein
MTLNQLKKRVDKLVELGYGRLSVFVDRGIGDEAGVVPLNSVQVQGMVTVTVAFVEVKP